MVKGTKMLIIGGTFKEDCPDVRNSKIIDFIIQSLKEGLILISTIPSLIFLI